MQRAEYLDQLLALLPPGWAWPRDANSRLAGLLSPGAAELARIDAGIDALREEADPRTATAMLVDWERVTGLPDACAPNVQFSRASPAYYFDGAGVLRQAAIDEPRYFYDAAGNRTETIIDEAAAENLFENPRGEGGVPGTAALPLGYQVVAPAGLATTFQGGGLGPDDRPHVDIRIHGVSTTPFYELELAAPGIAVTPGGTYTQRIGLALVGGSAANLLAVSPFAGLSEGPVPGALFPLTPGVTDCV